MKRIYEDGSIANTLLTNGEVYGSVTRPSGAIHENLCGWYRDDDESRVLDTIGKLIEESK